MFGNGLWGGPFGCCGVWLVLAFGLCIYLVVVAVLLW